MTAVHTFPMESVNCETPDEELRRSYCMMCDESLFHVKQRGCTERKPFRPCRWPKQLRAHPTASDKRRTVLSELRRSEGERE